MIFT
jgi:DegV family protein with EDD domain